jgi:hypothetical protein
MLCPISLCILGERLRVPWPAAAPLPVPVIGARSGPRPTRGAHLPAGRRLAMPLYEYVTGGISTGTAGDDAA